MIKRNIRRRHMLQGLGGLAVGLPWLEKLGGHQARAQLTPSGPKRVIVMAYEMGIPTPHWAPTGQGASMTLPYVTAPLESFKEMCLFVSELDNQVLSVGGQAFVWGHPAKKEAALTGTLTTTAFPTTNSNLLSEVIQTESAEAGANSASVEQIIGAQLRSGHLHGAVNLCVDGDAINRAPGESATSHFFFESRGNPVTMMAQPDRAFDQIFAGVTLGDEQPSDAELALRRLRARNMSVLDGVRDSFAELQKGLGADDRRRLQEHAELIRQLELDIQVSATCSEPSIPTGMDWAGQSMAQLAPLMNRVLAHAMTCDLAPIGRIEYLNQQSPRFGVAELDSTLDGATDYDWHAMVHGDALPGTTTFLRPGRGDDTAYDQRLLDGYRFFVEQFADLLGALDAIPEGDAGQTALDHSLLILATDLGEGMGHGLGKMGYIMAGNLGGARTGYHLRASSDAAELPGVSNFYSDSNYNVNQLLNSICDMAGATDDSGQALEVGLGGFISDRGISRRIDEIFV